MVLGHTFLTYDVILPMGEKYPNTELLGKNLSESMKILMKYVPLSLHRFKVRVARIKSE